MKRHNIRVVDASYFEDHATGSELLVKEDKFGEWVRHCDVIELEEENRQLKNQVSDLQGFANMMRKLVRPLAMATGLLHD